MGVKFYTDSYVLWTYERYSLMISTVSAVTFFQPNCNLFIDCLVFVIPLRSFCPCYSVILAFHEFGGIALFLFCLIFMILYSWDSNSTRFSAIIYSKIVSLYCLFSQLPKITLATCWNFLRWIHCSLVSFTFLSSVLHSVWFLPLYYFFLHLFLM